MGKIKRNIPVYADVLVQETDIETLNPMKIHDGMFSGASTKPLEAKTSAKPIQVTTSTEPVQDKKSSRSSRKKKRKSSKKAKSDRLT